MLVVSPPAHDGATGFFYRLSDDAANQAFGQSEYPDLSDAATLGCVTSLVREARGSAYTKPSWSQSGDPVWEVYCRKEGKKVWLMISAHTEGEALVAALEKAP
jgi:hypothetical protein